MEYLLTETKSNKYLSNVNNILNKRLKKINYSSSSFKSDPRYQRKIYNLLESTYNKNKERK